MLPSPDCCWAGGWEGSLDPGIAARSARHAAAGPLAAQAQPARTSTSRLNAPSAVLANRLMRPSSWPVRCCCQASPQPSAALLHPAETHFRDTHLSMASMCTARMLQLVLAKCLWSCSKFTVRQVLEGMVVELLQVAGKAPIS